MDANVIPDSSSGGENGFKMMAANDSYFLNIGPNVDIAFIVMCAYAIDELFSDQK